MRGNLPKCSTKSLADGRFAAESILDEADQQQVVVIARRDALMAEAAKADYVLSFEPTGIAPEG